MRTARHRRAAEALNSRPIDIWIDGRLVRTGAEMRRFLVCAHRAPTYRIAAISIYGPIVGRSVAANILH